MLGGIFGTISILSMVVIGYDRYNVICKGFNGVKITAGKVIFVNCMKLFDFKGSARKKWKAVEAYGEK